MKKFSTLLATTLINNSTQKYCITNYRCIARINGIYYNHKETYKLSNIFQGNHENILCINHFSVFATPQITSLLNTLVNDISIVLPKDKTNLPLDMIPFLIKNNNWSNKFIDLYIKSTEHNLYNFINNFGFISNPNILYTDMIQLRYNQNKAAPIIKQYADLASSACINIFEENNKLLGII